jgi:hypothetical protein
MRSQCDRVIGQGENVRSETYSCPQRRQQRRHASPGQSSIGRGGSNLDRAYGPWLNVNGCPGHASFRCTADGSHASSLAGTPVGDVSRPRYHSAPPGSLAPAVRLPEDCAKLLGNDELGHSSVGKSCAMLSRERQLPNKGPKAYRLQSWSAAHRTTLQRLLSIEGARGSSTPEFRRRGASTEPGHGQPGRMGPANFPLQSSDRGPRHIDDARL